ncbi:TetR/AcrR family transcriptional regulator [Paenibacillus sp. IHBB 10380]|uniref:TetR/AcrR family transcriptional regulator n=1 Tax=Paenibacillus sp. IHBB 10380 TaxID=1566358 RepID=UPI0005CFD590|nr:TetR/AcrR family transcriptional regulator [Paenibacillus sp. IHBB 10380]AJS61014.1 TetR family transcriptional regulator [Paenibacillus sp. IHBB 10380]
MVKKMGLDRNIILAAATELADKHGLETLTLSALAEKLSIRSPSLYNHIDGLPGLRVDLAVYGLQQLRHMMIDAVIGKSGNEAARSLAISYVKFARLHPGLYEAVYRPQSITSSDLEEAGNALVEMIIRVLEPFQLGEVQTIHSVRGLRSLLHGFASLEQNDGFRMSIDRDESLHYMIDTFLQGLKH